MAFLCGFFSLAIFQCLFYYDKAVRRDTDVAALSSDDSLESRQVSSRDARTDAKLVRSHDTSLFVKRGSGCRVKVADTTCADKSLSPKCCDELQAGVCYAFKDYDVNWTQPMCDKFNGREPDKTVCSDEKDKAANAVDSKIATCLKDATSREMAKAVNQAIQNTTKSCRVKVADTTCEFESLSPGCCEEEQAEVCYAFKDYNVSWKQPLCDKFNGREPDKTVCSSEADKAFSSMAKNSSGGKCVADASSREMQRAKTQPTPKPTPACDVKVGDITCKFERLSPECCEEHQALACFGVKDYNVSWKPLLCDKFGGKKPDLNTVCSSRGADEGWSAYTTYLKSSACLSTAILHEISGSLADQAEAQMKHEDKDQAELRRS